MQQIIKLVKHFHGDSLYRNSIYLMLSTGVMSFFGFFFWIVNTKLFTSEQIGLSVTLLSSITLITGFSLVGMNTGIIRYLSKSENRNDQINTVFILVLISTLITTSIYILGLEKFSPKILFIRQNIYLLIFFALVAVSSTFESIHSSIFMAYRDTKFVFINNTIKSILKLALPIFLISLGSYAIFASASVGSILVVLVSFFILKKLYKYTFNFTFNKKIFLNMYKFSFGNYIATLLSSLPITILPIMITNTLGPSKAAYYYIDAMIIALLSAIQSSINNSLFAEASNEETQLNELIIKSLKPLALLLIPAILITIFFGGYILQIFGKEYSSEGIILLRLLAISLIFTTLNSVLSTVLNIKHKINLILLMCIIGPIILLTFIYFMLPHGLISLGYGWLFGEALIALIYSILVYFKAHE